MKYCFHFLLIFFIFLTACSTNVQNEEVDLKISDVKLTQLEQGMMNLVGDNSIIFEMQVKNDAANEIELTVDHYENGELQGTEMYFTASLHDMDDSNPIHIIIANRGINDQHQWIGSVIAEDSSASFQTDLTAIPVHSASTFVPIDTPFSVQLNEKKLISTLILSKDGPIHANIKSEQDLEEVHQHDHVYVFYALVK
ncbi:hypothetical protein [Pseudogracilibacillus auburnensis]|uniref:hypothetical protein n=1 Tax=Pseudogracilibacillus auburnensis TaxID=1494959 RepID=UPI001A958F72|nr:hypothetical protein [Pseudogracilibacillus auburnensis]MBO1002375.1 hypothetical protein [Pseudogracilibacillus auburnensis]